ncbi:MAG: hypothetical protein AB1899_03830 [Pseudomonadota bacterium]
MDFVAVRELRTVRGQRFEAALRKMQDHAEQRGLSGMTMEEIDAEIALARKEGIAHRHDGELPHRHR